MKKKLLILGLLMPLFVAACSTVTENTISELSSTESSLVTSESSINSNSSSRETSSSSSRSSSESSSAVNIPVSSVSLDKTSLDIYTNNKDVKLTPTISPSNATNKSVTWTSSETDVATVSNGNITPLEEGTTTITVTTVDGNKTASCVVSVYKYNPIPDHVVHIKYAGESDWSDEVMEVNSYSLSEYMIQGISLKANDVFKIHLSGDVWYGYSALKKATPSGLVTDAGSDDNIKVLSSGTYDIYCDYNQDSDGKHIYLAKKGSVDPTPSVVHVTDITLDRSGKFMQYRHEYKLTATVYPSHASNKKVIWSSSDTDIATVTSEGRIIAKSKTGSTVITAKTEDGGKTATCIVYVSADQYPDYYLNGTINGKTRSMDYRLLAGVPVGDGRYLISDVELKKGDKIKIYSEKDRAYIRSKKSPYGTFEYEVKTDAYVNIYLNPKATNDNDYLTLVNKGTVEIFVSYPSNTNDDNQCAWLWVSGNDIQSKWIKSSSLNTGSTGSSFLIPNKATSFTFVRASRDATPTEEYGSIGTIKRVVGPINIEEGVYNYDVNDNN